MAGSRTALTGYHRRNCGFCPTPFQKKAASKRLGRVFLFEQMLEQCVAAPVGSPYLQWRLSDPVTSSKSVLRGAAGLRRTIQAITTLVRHQ